jgi:hypothetical protein
VVAVPVFVWVVVPVRVIVYATELAGRLACHEARSISGLIGKPSRTCSTW